MRSRAFSMSDTNYFFDRLDDTPTESLNDRQRLSLDVARNFTRIRSERCREAFAQLCRVMADEDEQLGRPKS